MNRPVRPAVLLLVLLLGASSVAGASAIGAPADAELVHDGETMTLTSETGQEVHGRTDLPAGTKVSVRLRSGAGTENPFLMTATATVAGNGSFEATFDLAEVAPGTAFEVVVHHDGDRLATAEGRVVACPNACETATPAATPTPVSTSEPPSGERAAIQSMTAVEYAGTARIAVGFGDAEALTVSIGGPEVNYVVDATVRDGNGDGRATLLFNTTAAGTDRRTLAVADGADELSVHEGSETRFDYRSAREAARDSLDPGDYPLALHRGTKADDPIGTGTLVILDGDDDERRPPVPATERATPERATEFGLAEKVLTTRRGQTTVIPVHVADADAATIVIGGSDDPYGVTATVRDGTGDGRVSLLLDTAGVGDDGALIVADRGDSVTVSSTSGAEGALPSADYGISLHRGTEVGSGADDVGTLVVNEAPGAGSIGPGPTDGSGGSGPLDGNLAFGALAVGGLLAVAGLGLLLGVIDL